MRWLKRALLALLFSLLLGFAIGTAIRMRLEQPVVYIGSTATGLPLHIGHTGAAILDSGHHEEQVG